MEDGKGDHLSETNLEDVWRIVDDELGHPGAQAYAHSFQEGVAVPFGGISVRYVAPSDIQNDPNLRAVFFKTNLSTGWDCPRAEVMMSFRTARDATLIAQLVGRMVRTPLAKSIAENELLNAVKLYLPFFDKAAVKRVIDDLTDPDGEAVPIEVEEGNDSVDVRVADALASCRELLCKIPNYAIPRMRAVSQINRLNRLARLLAKFEIDEDAVDAVKEFLCNSLERQHHKLRNDPTFATALAKLGRVELVERRHRVFEAVDDTSSRPVL